MKTTSPTYLAQELMAQWGWRALDEGRMAFAVRAHELAKLIMLHGVFPQLRTAKI